MARGDWRDIGWKDHVALVLRAAGVHTGRARERVIDILAGQPCALSAGEIERILRAAGSRTGRATIYRTLDLLVEHGLAERIDLGDGHSRYERTLPSGEHHHHLVCHRCGRLVAFDDPGLERAINRLSARLGVRVDSHEVVLRGACAGCD
jgi:Fur family ferric uptake transcriptional regulator